MVADGDTAKNGAKTLFSIGFGGLLARPRGNHATFGQKRISRHPAPLTAFQTWAFRPRVFKADLGSLSG